MRVILNWLYCVSLSDMGLVNSSKNLHILIEKEMNMRYDIQISERFFSSKEVPVIPDTYGNFHPAIQINALAEKLGAAREQNIKLTNDISQHL
jgi:hypothetical protein